MADYVISSGQTSSYDVGSGSTLTVESGGISRRSIIMSGAQETVSSGARVNGDVISSGGLDTFYRGATENNVTVHAGGVLSLADAVVRNGATLDIGLATSQQQFAGVTLDQGAGLWSLDALIGYGGTENVSSGGVALNTTLNGSGQMFVDRGGVVDSITINGGGLLVDAGAVNGAVLDNGEFVYSGGAANTLGASLSGHGSFIDDQAPTVTISGDASSFSGRVELQSGTLEVADAGGLGTAKVIYLASQQNLTLTIDAADRPASGSTYASELQHFNTAHDRLDLAGVRFTSGATATVSGSTLTVMDGTYTASFDLVGAVAKAYVVQSDGSGGTLIHAKAGAGTTASLVQAAAGFAPSSDGLATTAPTGGHVAPTALAAAPTLHHQQA